MGQFGRKGALAAILPVVTAMICSAFALVDDSSLMSQPFHSDDRGGLETQSGDVRAIEVSRAYKDSADALVARYGWVYDNGARPVFYSAGKSGVELHRLYNPGLKVGQRIFTGDEAEFKALTSKHGWRDDNQPIYAVELVG